MMIIRGVRISLPRERRNSEISKYRADRLINKCRDNKVRLE
jgi:hypothetical protein